MLTEGRVRAIAVQVALAIVRKFNPNISEEQIAEVQKNAEAAIAAKTAAEEAAARAEEAANRLMGVAVVGVIDENRNIVLTGPLEDGTYTAYYEVQNDDGTKSLLEIGELTKGEAVTPDPVTYTITWANYDGTVLETDTVTKGVTPEYNGATPTKPADSQYTYTFTGWTPEVVAATANATYTATYTQTAVEPTYENLADPGSADWKEGYKLSINTGGVSALEGHTTTNFIPCKAGDTLRIKGMNITGYYPSVDGANYAKIIMYYEDKTKIGGLYGFGTGNAYDDNVVTEGEWQELVILVGDDGNNVAITAIGYIRIDGFLTGSSSDVIINIIPA